MRLPAARPPGAHRLLAILCCAGLGAATVVASAQTPAPLPSEAELRAALERTDDPAAHDLLGVVLSRQGRFDEALAELQRAVEAEPRSIAAQQHLARLYLTLGRQQEALPHLEAAAALGPLERDLSMQLALAELSAGKVDAAERQLVSLVERFDSVQAMLHLARIHARRQQPSEALALLRRAAGRAPNSEEVLATYAQVALTAKAPITSVAALEPLTRMHPEAPDYFYLLGVARMQIGDMVGAEEVLRRAVELDPSRPLHHIALGLALNQRKRYEEAAEELERALERSPDSLEALAALAEAEEGLDRLDEAEEHASQVLRNGDADNPTALLAMGMVRMKQARYAEARDALEKALASDPGSSKAHYQLSLAYSRLGDDANAQRQLELYRKSLAETEQNMRELQGRTLLPEADDADAGGRSGAGS